MCGTVLLLWGRSDTPVPAGLPRPDALTRYGLPLATYAHQAAAALTPGLLVLAAALLPTEGKRLAPHARRAARLAAVAAVCWAVASSALLVLRTADTYAVPTADALDGSLLSAQVATTQGRVLVVAAVAALVAAAGALCCRTGTALLCVLLPALVGVAAPASGGHAAASGNHDLAVTGMLVHLTAAALWAGGLVALAWYMRSGGPHAAAAARRFGGIAAVCLPAVGASGLLSVLARTGDWTALATTRYGALLGAKVLVLLLLTVCGWALRRRLLAGLADGGRAAFRRLLAAELAAMALVFALAVALSRSPAPAPRALPGSAAEVALGYRMPPELTWVRLFTQWRPEALFSLGVLVAAGLYAAGVLRLRRRGDAWPVGRTVCWFTGLALVFAATASGLGVYGPLIFWVHMLSHMTLAMLAPIFLVLGAPVTLALRALPVARAPYEQGPREWLLRALHSRATRLLGHPLVAAALFVTGTYAVYFTPLFETLMRNHFGHVAMSVHFLLAGCLFFWIVIGPDPAPKRPPYPMRLLLLLITLPFHAFFSISVMAMSEPIGAGWYSLVRPAWAGSLLADQNTGGAVGWAVADIPTLVVLIALFRQWWASEERRNRHSVRAEAKAEAELASYNAYLARLQGRPSAPPAPEENPESAAERGQGRSSHT